MKSCNKTITFLNVSFLSSSELSVVFDIWFSHSNTNLPINCFSHEEISII